MNEIDDEDVEENAVNHEDDASDQLAVVMESLEQQYQSLLQERDKMKEEGSVVLNLLGQFRGWLPVWFRSRRCTRTP